MGTVQSRVNLDEQERLFLGLAEQLAYPLLQIAHLSELRIDEADTEAATTRLQAMHTIARASLQLVDNYALSLRVQGKVTPLALEPMTISSLLYDTAQVLEPLAQQYGVALELDTGPRSQPVIADRSILQAAMVSLGQVFVTAQAETDTPAAVRLAAHRSRYGVVAGFYGAQPGIGADSLRRARVLQGRAEQPFQRLVSGPATGVFVADSLLQTLAAHLHVARYHKLTGLATTLQPSHQLQLV